MNKNKLPNAIKSNIITNKLTSIIIGVVIIIIAIIIQKFAFKSIEPNVVQILNTFLNITYLMDGIFLILYPLILLVLNVDARKIKKEMKLANIDLNTLNQDYNQAKKIGKLRMGTLATYSSNFYHYYAIPNNNILTVYKAIKERKAKSVQKYNNGAIKKELYTIKTTQQFSVKITTVHRQCIRVVCKHEKTADEIINNYKIYPNIILGNPNSLSLKKQIKARRNTALKREKELINNEK